MNTFKRIRVDLFKIQQAEFGKIAGVAQATVSRWETGELLPSYEKLRRIREEAIKRRIKWNDALFFVPGSNDGKAA